MKYTASTLGFDQRLPGQPVQGTLLPASSEYPILGETDAAHSSQAWAPLVAAVLLDIADVFSLGPHGIVIGLLVGTSLGWRIAATSGLSPKARLFSAAAAAIYCAIPGTELLPLASMATTGLKLLQVLAVFRRR